METMSKDTPKQVQMARTFASAAYLLEVEPGTFMLYRNIEVECRDPLTGGTYREKVKTMEVSPMPLREFDPKNDDERQIVMQTVHPTTAAVIRLVEVGHR